MDKRSFIAKLSAASLAPFISFDALPYATQGRSESGIKEPGYWQKIRNDYDLKTDYINLENGYYCIMPRPVMDHYHDLIRHVNREGSRYMRTVQFENQTRITRKVANLAGCDANNLILTRNTTESLDMVIAGQNWKKGDQAVMALQDYGAMLNQFKMMSERFGIENKIVSIPNHPISDEEIVELYRSAITKKTRLLMICHMINITGQVLPIRKICDMAHKYGVKVMVDGAHAFAHLDFKIDELNCDYYGTSLHKWLSVPLGAGFLYVSSENIPDLWPLFAENEMAEDKIARLNHTGTHPVHTHLAIETAIEYHQAIGIERKSARLKDLHRYWADQLKNEENIVINTPFQRKRHGGIGNVGVANISPPILAKILFEEYDIWTVAIDSANVQGVRVTPNLYTLENELDRFTDAMKEIAS